VNTLHIQNCDRCGGSLKDGYEVREHGLDENGYADEEILCGRCAEPVYCFLDDLPLGCFVAFDAKDGAFTEFCALRAAGENGEFMAVLFPAFQYPDRIQIGRVRYLESA
jgi:hypothetical protein